MRRRDGPSPLWLGLLLNGGARALTVAAPMVTLPLVTDGLGTANYGAYAVVTAIAAFLPFADLGLSLGMVTAISQASGRNDRDQIRTVVSTGFSMLVAVMTALLVVGGALLAAVDWRQALGLADPRVTGDVTLAAGVVLVSFAIGLPASAGMKVLLGLQMNAALALWQALAVPVVVGAVVLAHAAGAGLPAYVFATVACPNIVAGAGTLWLFWRRRPDLRPRLRLTRRRPMVALFALGLVYSVQSATSAVAYSTDSVVISHVVGVDAAGVYNIASRLSSVALLIFQGLFLPMWPVFGSGLAAGDLGGSRRRLRKASLVAVGGGAISAVGFVVLGAPVITLWVGSAYTPPLSLLVGLAAWSLVQFAQYPFALFLSGAGTRRVLLTTAIAMAVTNLPLSILLAHLVGVSGPTWGSVISTTVCVFVVYVRYSHRLLDRAEAEAAAGHPAGAGRPSFAPAGGG